jgi:hypothetical protein
MRSTTGWSLNDPTASNAVTAERRLSLIDAALLWSGWRHDGRFRSRTVPGDHGHAADSGTGQPPGGRVSRRRLSGRGDSPTSRNATTEPASVVQCLPAAKKVAR